jgi:hypothetical protein
MSGGTEIPHTVILITSGNALRVEFLGEMPAEILHAMDHLRVGERVQEHGRERARISRRNTPLIRELLEFVSTAQRVVVMDCVPLACWCSSVVIKRELFPRSHLSAKSVSVWAVLTETFPF